MYLFLLFMRVLLSWFPGIDWNAQPWTFLRLVRGARRAARGARRRARTEGGGGGGGRAAQERARRGPRMLRLGCVCAGGGGWRRLVRAALVSNEKHVLRRRGC